MLQVGLTWPALPVLSRKTRNPDFYVKLSNLSMLATNLNSFKIFTRPSKTRLQAEFGSWIPALAFCFFPTSQMPPVYEISFSKLTQNLGKH